MFIFDEPYISDIAINYLVESQQPTLLTDFSSKTMPEGVNSVSKDQAREFISQNNNGWLYTNSENSIATIVDLVGEHSPIMQKVRFFKNKFKFREATKYLFPDIYYKDQIFSDFVPHQTSFTTPYYTTPRSPRLLPVVH